MMTDDFQTEEFSPEQIAIIHKAVVKVLLNHFSDWRMSEIEVSEQEAAGIAAEVTQHLTSSSGR